MQLDYILQSATCAAAFQLNGDDMTSLKPSGPAMADAAVKTRALWASLDGLMPETAMMVAKRDGAISIASRKGGLIIEASGAVNLGILRGALQNEGMVAPGLSHVLSATSPGPRALWSLADWIEQIEASREMQVDAGEQSITVWAQKGRFALPAGLTPSDLAKAVLAAGRASKPVELSYNPWSNGPGNAAPKMAYRPIDLFARTPSATAEWVLDDTGCPKTLPRSATLQDVAQAATLGENLLRWADGEPSEISVLNGNAVLKTIARFDATSEISIGTQGLE